MRILIFICLLSIGFFFVSSQNAEAQLWKKLKKKAQETAERSLEKKTEKETEEAMEEILEGGDDSDSKAGKKTSNKNSNTKSAAGNENVSVIRGSSSSSAGSANEEIVIYTKSDFIPGEQTIFYEDFSNDKIGDFPVLWNTDFTGEVVKVTGSDEKWLMMAKDANYFPDTKFDFPENYTIEFDLMTVGTSKKTSGSARFKLQVADATPMDRLKSYAYIIIPFVSRSNGNYSFRSQEDGKLILSNNVRSELKDYIQDRNHFSISVTGPRFRLYINGDKKIDLPRFMPSHSKLNTLILYSSHFGKDENVLMTNLRFAKGEPQVRNQLFTSGKFTTDAIHFDVNSANIKPASYGIIKEIAAAMADEPTKNVIIIGHTDSDGKEDANLALSKKRANSVKDALVNSFGIDDSRISTDGKGESEPILANDSSLNKAKNRRVEFVLKN